MSKEENIQNKHAAIKSVHLDKDILTVDGSMPIRRFIKDPKEYLNTEMVLSYVKDEYQIVSIVQESKISNWSKQGYSRQGSWKFKVKVAKKRTRRKNTFRDRITNIAKNKEQESE